MKGSTVYQNGNTGIEVTVTKQAQALIGPARVAEFIKVLTTLLAIVGTKRAQVSKCGWSVRIHFVWPGGFKDSFTVPVER